MGILKPPNFESLRWPKWNRAKFYTRFLFTIINVYLKNDLCQPVQRGEFIYDKILFTTKINEIQKYWKKCIQDLINPASEKLQFVQTEIQRTVHRWNQLFIKPKDCKSDSCKDEVSTKYLIRSRPGCFAWIFKQKM